MPKSRKKEPTVIGGLSETFVSISFIILRE